MPKFSRVLVFLAGSFLFFPVAYSFEWPGFLLYQKKANAPNYRVGFSVANGGDVDGDGRADFMVGAPFTSPSTAGSAFIYSGSTGALLYQKDGSGAGDQLGISVAGVGDVNTDGKDDFIVGAYRASPGLGEAGSAYLYSGADGSLLFQKNGGGTQDQLGVSVAGAGDVNGDGSDDFIVGAWLADPGGFGDAGSAYVYSGATGTLLYQKDGASSGDLLGYSVASAGDANGDGNSDFIISAHDADPGGLIRAGSAYVYSGIDGSLLYQKDGTAANDALGLSVAGAGDVNADGMSDFIISALNADPSGLVDAGSVYIYSGADGSLIYQKNGAASFDYFGVSVTGVGDVDGDGNADFIIGDHQADPDGFDGAGSAFIYSGRTGSLLFQKNGTATSDQLGYSVAGVGDINGDGRADVVIGAPTADPDGFANGGSAFVLAARLINISSISDIPADQGRQAILRWKSIPGINDSLMDLFIVYLRLDSNSTSTAQKILTPDANPLPPSDWAQVAVVAATGDSTYTTIVPTLGDSTSEGTKYSVYFVRGRSTNPLQYIDSPLDSSYSVDNLVPSAPSSLAAVGTCQGIQLSYSQPVDEDFRYFKIYRDTSVSFATAAVVGTSIDSFFVDAAPVSKSFFYRVSAVDFSGNEGGPSPAANALAGLKGDLNVDAGLSPADVVLELNAVFLNSPIPAPFCVADGNCDGRLNPADVVIELNAVFLGTTITCTP